MQVLQPQGLFINKPFYTSMHKHCFYTSPAFKQALLLHKSVFTQDLLLHKPCFYTSAVFTQALLLHKTCFYTNAVFTQALSLHKHCLYTRPAFTQKRFYTRPPFTQTLSLHKLCLYTSIAFIQALLLHNDILLTKAFCNLQTGNRLEGRRNAEGCKYNIRPVPFVFKILNYRSNWAMRGKREKPAGLGPPFFLPLLWFFARIVPLHFRFTSIFFIFFCPSASLFLLTLLFFLIFILFLLAFSSLFVPFLLSAMPLFCCYFSSIAPTCCRDLSLCYST